VQALADIQLALPSSGIIAIIGPNGAGKTTLFNVITGILRPNFGKTFLGDKDITSLQPHLIARLGVARTFQDLRFMRQVSVSDNVMLARPNQRGENFFYALTRIGVAKEEAVNRSVCMDLIRFVGLEDKADRLAGELSYGQQKLLTLACCIATGARILLLDEPVAGVYPEMIEHILDFLLKLKVQDKLIVLVEHDLTAVRRVADQVIVMDEGHIIAEGPPVEVLARPEIMEAYVG
jgi:ABC-type branched-subunit amino acid transport system ATPase component